MNAPKFLIAKYAPDVIRMEPRNFGLLAWSPKAVAARFLGVKPGSGGVRPPSFVRPDHREAYRQWIEYWNLMMAPAVEGDARTRLGVNLDSPDFLSLMRSKGKLQFFFVEAGSLPHSVDVPDFQDMVDEVFAALVDEEQPPAEDTSRQLSKATQKVVRRSGLSGADDFQQNYALTCRVGKLDRAVTFDYALGPTADPKVLFQKVAIQNEKSLQSALFMFEHVQASSMRLMKAARCAFVYGGDTLTERTARDVAILAQYAHVVDVAHEDTATEDVSRFLSRGCHESERVHDAGSGPVPVASGRGSKWPDARGNRPAHGVLKGRRTPSGVAVAQRGRDPRPPPVHTSRVCRSGRQAAERTALARSRNHPRTAEFPPLPTWLLTPILSTI
jgi:hypothetical protein